MIRRLTEDEINRFASIDNRNRASEYIGSLEKMGNFFSQVNSNSYMARIESFLRFSSNFHYQGYRRAFAKNLWISDSLNELPTIQEVGLKRREAIRFVESIVGEEGEYYWPEDLEKNKDSIANIDIATRCDEIDGEWHSSELDNVADEDDFVEYLLEYFTYYIETPSVLVDAVDPKKQIKAKAEKTEIKQTKKRNGEKIMNIFGEGFGTIEGMAISMMTGEMAIPGEDGKFFTFNSKSKEITDVSDMVIEMELPAYAMPVAPETIVAGDIVRHNGQFLFVSSVTKAGKITGTKPDTAEEATIVPIKNALFNQSFVAKVTTMNMFASTPGVEGEAAKGPFGEMNPMLLMLMLKDKDGSSSNSMDKLLPLMMMQQGGLATGAADGQMNPMMMMLLMEKMGK